MATGYRTWEEEDEGEEDGAEEPIPRTFSAHTFEVDRLPFDDEFQHLVSQITDERILKEEESFRALSRLTRDFRFAAMTYGKVIIAEKHLDFANKTIKPTTELPGIAGGAKYFAGGIMFRFAVDRNALYGSDEFAGKVSGTSLSLSRTHRY